MVELFPFREGLVLVARFWCRTHGRTFSMLPWQLVPYHQYTLESMLLAVLLWRQVVFDGDGGASAAVEELPGDASVSPWLLRHWRGVLLAGLREAHSVLRGWYDLDALRSAEAHDGRGLLDEVHAYAMRLGGRDPPSRQGLREAARRYAAATGHPLAGRLSQER